MYNRAVIDRLLSSKEIEVEVFTAGGPGHEHDPRIHSIASGTVPPYYSPVFLRTLMRGVRDVEADLVHAFSTEMPYATAAGLLAHTFPSIMTVYGVAARETKYFKTEYTAFHQHLYRYLTLLNERWALGRISHLVVDSESIGQGLKRQTGAIIHVVPAGIEARRIVEMQSSLPDTGGPDIFLTVNLERLKGVDILIDAVDLLRARYPFITAWVAGRGPQADVLRAQIDRLGLQENVRLLGFVSDYDKVRLYRSCKLVVVASRWDCQPAALFEAAVAGKPVIASETSNPGIVENGLTGYVIPSERPDELADRIGALLDDEPLRRRMGAAAAGRAMRYDWDSVASTYIDIYYDVLNRRDKHI
jgi:glycosyltransferase involved in cell wall biosynthesis